MEGGVDAYVNALLPFIHGLARNRFQLAIENTPQTRPGDLNDFFGRIRRLGSEDSASVGMCFDVGHANLCPATHNDFVRYLNLLDPDIPDVHVCDAFPLPRGIPNDILIGRRDHRKNIEGDLSIRYQPKFLLLFDRAEDWRSFNLWASRLSIRRGETLYRCCSIRAS